MNSILRTTQMLTKNFLVLLVAFGFAVMPFASAFTPSASADTTEVVNESFDDFDGTLPSGWTGGVSHYNSASSAGESKNSVKFEDDSLELDFSSNLSSAEKPDEVSFWVKGNEDGSDFAGDFVVEESEDGSNWNEIDSFTPTTDTDGETKTFDLSEDTTKLRFTWEKDDGNVAFDDVAVTAVEENNESPEISNITPADNGDAVEVGNEPLFTAQVTDDQSEHLDRDQVIFSIDASGGTFSSDASSRVSNNTYTITQATSLDDIKSDTGLEDGDTFTLKVTATDNDGKSTTEESSDITMNDPDDDEGPTIDNFDPDSGETAELNSSDEVTLSADVTDSSGVYKVNGFSLLDNDDQTVYFTDTTLAKNNDTYTAVFEENRFDNADIEPGDNFSYRVEAEDNFGNETTEVVENVTYEEPDSDVGDDNSSNGSNNNGPVENRDSGDTFDTIQEAINDAGNGDTIEVGDGTYDEDLNVDVEDLTITNGSSPVINGQINVSASGVTISGLTVNNPNGDRGIEISGVGDLTITGNTFENIGSDISVTGGEIYGIWFQDSSSDVANINISDNTFTSIGNNEGKTTAAIGIGDSTGDAVISDITIQNNDISNVVAKHDQDYGNGGRGAYGILLNHAGPGYDGSITNAVITENIIDDIEGLWVHVIGLEGDTPNAEVSHNDISNVSEHKAVLENSLDGSGVFFQDNPSYDTVVINQNNFLTDGSWYGVAFHSSMSGSETIDATENYWNTVDESEIEDSTQTQDSIEIDIDPWLCDEFPEGALSVNGSCDSSAPSIEVITPEEDLLTNQDFEIEVKATDDEDLAKMVVSLKDGNNDGHISSCLNESTSGTEATSSCTVDISELPNREGDYYFRTNADDASGNKSNTILQKFTVDTAKPTATTISPESDEVVGGEVTFEADLTDDQKLADYRVIVHYKEGGVNDRVYYGDWTPIDNPGTENMITHEWDSAEHDDGEYHVRIFARDEAGNTATHHETEDRYFVVDNTDPEIEIEGETPKDLYSTSDYGEKPNGEPKLQAHIIDQNVGDTYIHGYTDDDRDASPHKVYEGGSTFDIKWLPDGKYDIYHVDAAGNESETYTFTYDKTAPDVDDVMLNEQGVDNDHIRVDNCQDIEHSYLVNDEIDLSATIEDNLTGVASARYKVRKVNSNGCSQAQIFNSNWTNLHEDDGTWAANEGTEFDTNDIGEDGLYTIQFETRDGAGNIETKFIDIMVDNTSPVIENVSLTPDLINSDESGPTLKADVEDAGSGVEKVQYKVYASDGSTVAGYKDIAYNSSTNSVDEEIDIEGLEDGDYNLGVRAFDRAGNKKNVGNAASSIQIPFTVDNTDPYSNISNPDNNSVVGPNFTIEGEAYDDAGDIERVKIYVTKLNSSGGFAGYVVNDDADYENGTESFTYDVSGLESGNYTIKAQAFDEAGNNQHAGTVAIEVNDSEEGDGEGPGDTTAPSIVSGSLDEVTETNVTSADMREDGMLKVTITTDEELDEESPLYAKLIQDPEQNYSYESGLETDDYEFTATGNGNEYEAYIDLNDPVLVDVLHENMMITMRIEDDAGNHHFWIYNGSAEEYDNGEASLYLTVDNMINESSTTGGPSLGPANAPQTLGDQDDRTNGSGSGAGDEGDSEEGLGETVLGAQDAPIEDMTNAELRDLLEKLAKQVEELGVSFDGMSEDEKDGARDQVQQALDLITEILGLLQSQISEVKNLEEQLDWIGK